MDFGVAKTGIFFGVEDSAGDTAVLGLEGDFSAGAARASVSFVIVGGSLVSAVFLEPLTLISGDVLAVSWAIGFCTAGVAVTGFSFF